MPVFELQYNSIPESEDQLYRDAYEILENNEISGNLRQHFLLSLSEAFTNAMVHGNKMVAESKIKVRLSINEESISADISDEGLGGLDSINKRKRADLLSEGGRGIDLMQHFCSKMTFAQLPQGLKVSLTFSRHNAKQEKSRA